MIDNLVVWERVFELFLAIVVVVAPLNAREIFSWRTSKNLAYHLRDSDRL